MARLDFETLINANKYQVFLVACPAWMPVQFARHPWFVINKKGLTSRWEVSAVQNTSGVHWGHVSKDMLSLFQGIHMFAGSKIFWNKIHFIGSIEGGENSVAQKMIQCIEQSGTKDPYRNIYNALGPNSNTYAQWIIKQFPEFNVKLSWRFIGKNYNKKR